MSLACEIESLWSNSSGSVSRQRANNAALRCAVLLYSAALAGAALSGPSTQDGDFASTVPRGFQLTTSNRERRPVKAPAARMSAETPEAPGPPGLNSTTPLRLDEAVAFSRTTSRAIERPSGRSQSTGTETVAGPTSMLTGVNAMSVYRGLVIGQLSVQDSAVAAAVAVLGLAIYNASAPAQSPLGQLVVLAGCLPLAWRSRRPVLVLGLVEAALATAVIADPYLQGVLTPCSWFAIYSVAATPKPVSRFAPVLLCTPAVVWLTTQDTVSWFRFALFATQSFALTAAFWALGRNHRLRQEHADLYAERAAAEERARVARDLHDLLASTLTGVVALARGARNRPETAAEVFALIEQTGREGLTETREVLRAQGNCRPGLDRLPSLVERAENSGVPVRLTVDGDPTGLPAETDLAAYRIAQEALTNAIRHGDGEITVRVDHTKSTVDISVDNPVSTRTEAKGLGLAGMTERARRCGGTVHAGPTDGGWSVLARLPR
ncbi:histidine kinase [Allokutzneria sp. A3M-2-11 16]|uniref:sensor histidine kinase n=1 Tax=Allokutzneria sp. A3M-2-11 16 TaxID=2962043 RepID=UPI0020B700BF|nr:histidine kinase [Allokutzneria sp. A3M-2-11 16]MCP3805581.1 histidine kinase [Allokutzneria sp. A3M-2-11 16]